MSPTRVLTDFHHSSLLRATHLLFEERLGFEVQRPIGMEWFDQGYWAVNDQRDTAEQFLAPGSQPVDNTPPLNSYDLKVGGQFRVYDPGRKSTHRACTLDFFKHNQFDYVIASIPAHIPLFKALVAKYQPNAKLIVQMGNEWPQEYWTGNVLASVKPRESRANAIFYHQEFDLGIFRPTPAPANRKVYSFINCLQQQMPLAWSDFSGLEMLLSAGAGFEFRSFGGQCRDGNMNGPQELADKMREASLIFHVKEGGDGFGHILYNAYAVGRPVITRRRFYNKRLGEELLVPGSCINLDEHNLAHAYSLITDLLNNPDELRKMGETASARFRERVDYGREAENIRAWLAAL